MSEKTVDDKKLANIEAQIAAKQAEEMKNLSEDKAKKIEEKVRAEFEAKEKEKALSERLAKIEEENKKLKEDSEAKLREQEDKIKNQEEVFKKKLEDALAVKQGIMTNNSPFENKEENSDNIKIVDGQKIDVSKLDPVEVEKLSGEQFKKDFNLPSFYFKKT